MSVYSVLMVVSFVIFSFESKGFDVEAEAHGRIGIKYLTC